MDKDLPFVLKSAAALRNSLETSMTVAEMLTRKSQTGNGDLYLVVSTNDHAVARSEGRE